MQLVGVNLSGAEFGSPGHNQVNTDYVMPTSDDIDYFAQNHMNVFRLPILWERAQQTPFAQLSENYISQIDSVITQAASKGIKVIIDLHNYGAGYGNLVGSDNLPVTALADFWSKIAVHYANSSNVIFGIMNEPNQQTADQWEAADQAAITAIRATGATQEILASGTSWSSAATWKDSGNENALTHIIDPLKNTAIDVHAYLDQDSSGTHYNPVTDLQIGVNRLTEVTNWAEQTGTKLFLGEIGAPSDAQSLKALSNTFDYMQQHSVWQGTTYWAAGDWWGDYPFSVQPTGTVGHFIDKPQMQVLEDVASKNNTGIFNSQIQLTDRYNNHFLTDPIITGQNTLYANQTNLHNNVTQSVGINKVDTISTPLWNDVKTIDIQDNTGHSYATNAFLEVNVQLSGAQAGSLLLTNAKTGVIDLSGNGNYTVTINAHSDSADSIVNGVTNHMNDFTITLGSGNDVVILHGDRTYTHGIFTTGSGHDVIFGAAGGNTITFGTGRTEVTGGTGTDNYIYHALSGVDIVQNFDSAHDTITLDSALKSSMKVSHGTEGTTLMFGTTQHELVLHAVQNFDTSHIIWA